MSKTSKQRQLLRQGDILLEPIDAIESGVTAVPKEQGAVVLAYGESHGHRHQIARGAKLFERGSTRFLEVSAKGGALLVVTSERGQSLPEIRHTEINVPPGAYRVTRQVEWSASDEVRVVAD